MSELAKLNERQAFKMVPWMQSLLIEHRKERKYCQCGHGLTVQNDTITGKGEYIVDEYCSWCDLLQRTRHSAEWVLLTTARIRRDRAKESLGTGS